MQVLTDSRHIVFAVVRFALAGCAAADQLSSRKEYA